MAAKEGDFVMRLIIQLMLIISAIFLAAPNLIAQSPERIDPLNTLESPPWIWLNSNFCGAPPPPCEIQLITDGIDGDYIFANTSGQVARIVVADQTGIPADATVDSVGIRWRGQDNGSGNNRQRLRLRMDGNANYCDGANQSLTTSWVTYEEFFTQAPSAGGSCGNSWTRERVDSINVQLTCTSVGAGKEVRVTELDIDVYYTEAGGATKVRRRRTLQMSVVMQPPWLWSF